MTKNIQTDQKNTFAEFQSNSIDSSFDVPDIKAVFNISDPKRKTSQGEQGDLIRGIVNCSDGARFVVHTTLNSFYKWTKLLTLEMTIFG